MPRPICHAVELQKRHSLWWFCSLSVSYAQAQSIRDYLGAVSHLVDENVIDQFVPTESIPDLPHDTVNARPVKPNVPLTILHAVQQRCEETYAADAMDDRAEFDMNVLGLSAVASKADAELLQQLVSKMTEKVCPTPVVHYCCFVVVHQPWAFVQFPAVTGAQGGAGH